MAFSTNISNPVRVFVIQMLTQRENSGNVNYFPNSTELPRIIMAINSENSTALIDYDSADNLTEGVGLLMPTWAYRSVAIYLLFISVLGLIMNVIVAIVILNDSQKMTPLNWMLLNLACSDGAIAGFGTPISTAAALQFGWPFSHELCVAYAMIMSTAGIGSITTLTVLAVWRCQLVVCCPAQRKSTFTNHTGRLECRYGVLILTLIWIYALAVTCPPLFGWGRYDREAAHISCSVNWESKKHYNHFYIFYMFVMGLVIPLVLIIVSYVKILRVVRERRRKGENRKTLKPLDGSSHVVQYNGQLLAEHQRPITGKRKLQQPNKNQQPHHHRGNAAEKKVTMMVACMIAAFMSAWMPYSILALFETFFSTSSSGHYSENKANISTSTEDDESFYVGIVSPGFATIPSLFAKTSAVLNPLIYGLLSTQFRLAWERFSLRFFSRRQHRRPLTEGVTASRQKQIQRRSIRQFRLNCNSDSLGQKAATTIHLPMKEIIFPNDEGKDLANSITDKITKGQPSTDIKATSSIHIRDRDQDPEEEAQQSRHNQQEQDKAIEDRHYQSLRLRSSTSTSLPLLSTCTLSHFVCPEVGVTCQSIKESSIGIQRNQEQPNCLISVCLLSHTADCYCNIEKSIFLNTSADAHTNPTAVITSAKNHSEDNQN